MSKVKSSYYYAELQSWLGSINFYTEQKLIIDAKLDEVIKRNSLIDIAAKVEAHQILLNEIIEKFNKIKMDIDSQLKSIKVDDNFIEDVSLNKELEESQTYLRQKISSAEKEYIDIKAYCFDFLSETLNK